MITRWVLATESAVFVTVQCWSARPDLWGPGLFITVDQPQGPRQTLASWGSVSRVGRDCQLAVAQGLDQPGVAEAAILTGELDQMASTCTWTDLEDQP